MSRSVPEWVGATPDSAIPARVKLRVWAREGGRCYLSGRQIMPGDAFDYEHVIPLALGGVNAETNIKLALRDKHREKTARDVAAKSKADRQKAAHLGLKPKSRGFRRPPGTKYDWSRGRYVKESE